MRALLKIVTEKCLEKTVGITEVTVLLVCLCNLGEETWNPVKAWYFLTAANKDPTPGTASPGRQIAMANTFFDVAPNIVGPQ